MATTKQKIGGILGALLEMLVGILLLINPVGFTQTIMIGAGVLMLLIGLVSCFKYFRTDAQTASLEQNLFKGLLLGLLGYLCIAKRSWLVATFPVLAILYGAVTLVSGLGKVQWTMDCIRTHQDRWYLSAISAVVSIICGLVILRSPFTTTAVLWTFTGVTIIVEAVLDIVALLFSKKKEVQEEAEEFVEDGV